MRRRFARSVLMLLLLVVPLLGCSQEQVVTVGTLPTHSPNPPPPVPTKQSLVVYVGPAGDDDNPGTLDRPWRTLKEAFKRVYAGQVLYVRGGTYHETIDHIHLHLGRADKRITVMAYPGENPVLMGAISLRRPAHWTIDNLDVTGDPSLPASGRPAFMVKVVGGRGWTWQNSAFTGTTGRANVMISGWGVTEPTGFNFRGNCLNDVPEPPQRSTNLLVGPMRFGAHGNVSRNVIFNYDRQPNVRLGSGSGAPFRVKLAFNTIFGGSLGIESRGHPHHVKISRNIIGGGFAPAEIRFPRGVSLGTSLTNNVAVNAVQLLRPKVRNAVNGSGNVTFPGDPDFVDTTRCDGFVSGLDAMIPYGAFAP